MRKERQPTGSASKPGDEVAKGTSTLTDTSARLWNVREEVERPVQRVPVIANVDVVVAGGGVGGVIAAISAARHGASTLIVESCSSLGGNMGPAMFCRRVAPFGTPQSRSVSKRSRRYPRGVQQSRLGGRRPALSAPTISGTTTASHTSPFR